MCLHSLIMFRMSCGTTPELSPRDAVCLSVGLYRFAEVTSQNLAISMLNNTERHRVCLRQGNFLFRQQRRDDVSILVSVNKHTGSFSPTRSVNVRQNDITAVCLEIGILKTNKMLWKSQRNGVTKTSSAS